MVIGVLVKFIRASFINLPSMLLDKLSIVTMMTDNRIVDIVCLEGFVKYCPDEIAVSTLVGTWQLPVTASAIRSLNIYTKNIIF